ncbi:MAG TPA: cysteine desulfurase-like protein [Vicinamibacterales bacterium]|nr:cysteine desulfurase-like protein [Vicinamibacterales bacterium]
MREPRPFPVEEVRRRFPALEHAGDFVFFDNAAGAQVPSTVLDAVADHLLARNVQRGGPYRQSREVDALIVRARESVAAFVNAASPDEIAFGLNATSFIRAISLAVGQTLDRRSEIIVSDLDHEANVATWLALERAGARIVWWKCRVDEDGATLDATDLEPLLSERTRLVACTMASNAIGRVVDIGSVARRAHAVGAEVFVDAVHFSPHGSIDVRALGCDYLVCSGYKVFAPHMGFAWCRREAINRLPTFREAFIPDVTPDKLEAGTYVYENVAGMNAAVAYLEDLGRSVATPPALSALPAHSRVETIRAAMTAIAGYERTLSRQLLDAVETIRGVTVHGVTARDRLHERIPTLCFTVAGCRASDIAEGLAAREIGVRSGHMYSPRLMARLGLPAAGAVRASLVHYNTAAEIGRFAGALREVIETTHES